MPRTSREASRKQATVEYLDALFGPGAGERHLRFLDGIESPALRDVMHDYHALEADTRHLSVEENYLLGMTVLLATRSYGSAAMFAKTLLHRGVAKEKLLEATARLSMWVGGVAAVEGAVHIQRAIRDYELKGQASLEAWFPEPK
jgi:alkylhydroperoxidase/carboxymuconolactone decarboxylase family protein YurZ